MSNSRIPIYQVDAFASKSFEGNPAAVCPLAEWLPTATMQSIAMENNLAETAFFVKREDGDYDLRWFTPTIEVDLCGHATLASAHVIFQHLGHELGKVSFHTRSGALTVTSVKGRYIMDFPVDSPVPTDLEGKETDFLFKGLGIAPVAVYRGISDLLVEVEDQGVVEDMAPQMSLLKKVSARGIIVTARGDYQDFVSRFFAPQSGIDEDPVTGSAHTTLTPYWSAKLNKKTLTARQLSARGGELLCKLNDDRVSIVGEAVTVMEGVFLLGSHK